MKNYPLPALLIVFAVMSGACTPKIPYHTAIADVVATGGATVAVATHDKRHYVLSGNKRPFFVGLARGGYGNPFSIITASGNPLANDITNSIVNSLNRKGFRAIPVIVSHTDDRHTAVNKLKRAGGERMIYLSVTEWKTDAYMRIALYYDVNMEVMDREGVKLAESFIIGEEAIGGGAFWSKRHEQVTVPRAFKEKIEVLLNDPGVVAALR